MNPTTRRALEQMIEQILPGAQFDVDNYGQIVIYTNLTEEDNGSLREMTNQDFGNEENEDG